MSEAPIDQQMRDAEKQIRKKLLNCIPLIMLAIGAPLAAYLSLFIPSREPADIWFQRSGSLTVLFAVWMEYNLMKVNEDVNPSGRVTSQQSELSEKYQRIYKIAHYIVVTLVIFGTIIWGYGNFFR